MGYETEVVQKAVVDKLTKDGHKFWKEFPLGWAVGRADFIVNMDGAYYVVECKASCRSIKSSILQVLQYAYLLHPEGREAPDVVTERLLDDVEVRGPIREIREARFIIPCIIVPRYAKTQSAANLCKKYNVMLGVIDVPRCMQLKLF
jgi:predicted RecB family nuclease